VSRKDSMLVYRSIIRLGSLLIVAYSGAYTDSSCPVALFCVEAYAVACSSISRSCRFMLRSVRCTALLPLNPGMGQI
jgi:hypothetical protein